MQNSRTSAESGLCWLSKGCLPVHMPQSLSAPQSWLSYSVYWLNLSKGLWGSSWLPNFFFPSLPRLKHTYAQTSQFDTFKRTTISQKGVKGIIHQKRNKRTGRNMGRSWNTGIRWREEKFCCLTIAYLMFLLPPALRWITLPTPNTQALKPNVKGWISS